MRAVRFEDSAPVRGFKSYKGQRHLPGLWWSATVGGHIGYESRLERDHVMLLDFDPTVVGVSSQPFWLFCASEKGEGVSHAPDYFTRRDDGSAVVIDCRPADRRKPRDWAKFVTEPATHSPRTATSPPCSGVPGTPPELTPFSRTETAPTSSPDDAPVIQGSKALCTVQRHDRRCRRVRHGAGNGSAEPFTGLGRVWAGPSAFEADRHPEPLSCDFIERRLIRRQRSAGAALVAAGQPIRERAPLGTLPLELVDQVGNYITGVRAGPASGTRPSPVVGRAYRPGRRGRRRSGVFPRAEVGGQPGTGRT
ncbi:TnsA-like heteromeric transposase endonuclease subunit [Streptomyces scabiei]|uniref:TnsA-like heteromeric transposase endonuclease subunit n=1 Tax=Streptomyces scabiei TaxID=1930 RepID=UPI0036BB43A1